MTPHRGFTLIEILIVMVIIGITVGFALIAFGDFGASKRLQYAAEQLVNTIKLAQQQAILESSTLGLKIDQSSYQILKFQNNLVWKPISNKGIFKAHYLPKHTAMHLKTNDKNTGNTPEVVITPSGDMTPFTLEFFGNDEKWSSQIVGGHDGHIKLNTAEPQ